MEVDIGIDGFRWCRIDLVTLHSMCLPTWISPAARRATEMDR
jgi:hypothetical protein